MTCLTPSYDFRMPYANDMPQRANIKLSRGKQRHAKRLGMFSLALMYTHEVAALFLSLQKGEWLRGTSEMRRRDGAQTGTRHSSRISLGGHPIRAIAAEC